MSIEWTTEPLTLEPKCGALSSKRKTAMCCELPADHVVGKALESPVKYEFHMGRDRWGRWRSWFPRD